MGRRTATVSRSEQRIDNLLDSNLRVWRSLPRTAERYATWDDVEQSIWAQEWAIRETQLSRIKQLADDGAMNDSQRITYEELLQVEETNRSIVQKILRENGLGD